MSDDKRDSTNDLDPSEDRSTERNTGPKALALDNLGPYRLLQNLGEGGMGTVYLAAQEKPIRRQVAIKVIKLGMDTEEVVARFEAERQALAMMDHPCIAHVHDAGTTDRGRPYFVMEYVKGVPIHEYCRKHRLGIRERLELFAHVCLAVHHAHQKGIIHRDIKPSNILVTLQDGAPQPKVIDFGIAKAIGGKLTEKTIFTGLGHLMGTPAYMSPEQAEMSGLNVDTTTDVYSLGIVLYELLTGSLPIESKTLQEAGIETMGRIIREQMPPAPSGRIGALGKEAAEIASQGRLTAAGLQARLKGELDWIVMKAIEKDRTMRYQSASEFAVDIQHHLDNEPVLAGPPSTIYRLKKIISRHRIGFVFAGTLAVLTIAAGIWMSVLYTRAEIARGESEAVTGFLSNMLAAVDPGEQGRDVSVREVLDFSARTIDDEFAGQPLIAARLKYTMGDVYRSLGLYDDAQTLLEESVETRRSRLGTDHPEVAEALNALGRVLGKTGKFDEAHRIHEEALAIREKAFGKNTQETAKSWHNLGNMQWEKGDYEAAQSCYEKSLSIREEVLGANHPDVAKVLFSLGTLYKKTGDIDKAQSSFERALSVTERSLGPDHHTAAAIQNGLAALYIGRRDFDEARPLLERALSINETTFGPDHPTVASGLITIANLLNRTGEYEEARSYYERAVMVWENSLGLEHPSVAIALNNLAGLYQNQDDLESARPLFERALAIREKVFGPDHESLAATLVNLAFISLKNGEYDKARSQYERALTIYEQSLGTDHYRVGITSYLMGNFFRDTGELTRAENCYVRAHGIMVDKLPAGHAYTLMNLREHAELKRLKGDSAAALQLEARADSLEQSR